MNVIVQNARAAWECGYSIIAHELNVLLAGHGLSIPTDTPKPRFSYAKADAGTHPTEVWQKRVGSKLNDSCRAFRQSLLGIRPFVALDLEIPDEWNFEIWSLGFLDGKPSVTHYAGKRYSSDFIYGRDMPTADCELRTAIIAYESKGIRSNSTPLLRKKWKREIVDPIARHTSKMRTWFDSLTKMMGAHTPSHAKLIANPVTSFTSHLIPPEHRTMPMTKSEGAKLMGLKGNLKGRARVLSGLMAKGKVSFVEMNRQKFIFDKRQFPSAAQSKL